MRAILMFQLLLVSSIALSSFANALMVDFEDIPHEPVNGVGDVISGGFLFDPLTDHYHVLDHTYLGGPANGTTWLAIDDNLGNNPMTMSTIDGSAFSLFSVDIAEWFAEPSTNIQVTGVYSGGGSVSTNVILDQVWDGVGGVADFETIIFGAGWSSLSSVVFDSIGAGNGPHQGWAIDNINTSAVPAPPSLLIFATGIIGLALGSLGSDRFHAKH